MLSNDHKLIRPLHEGYFNKLLGVLSNIDFDHFKTGGESGIVFPPISEIAATMEKSFYPFAIADTFEIAAMKFDGG